MTATRDRQSFTSQTRDRRKQQAVAGAPARRLGVRRALMIVYTTGTATDYEAQPAHSSAPRTMPSAVSATSSEGASLPP